MREYISNEVLAKKQKLLNTVLIFLLGVTLGLFSKWLDSLGLNDSIPWQKFLGIIDLRNIFSELPIWILLATVIAIFSESSKRASLNVFLFFIAMNLSYNMYTVYVCGFNPKSYMMIWYTITLISPFLAALCWYAKKDSKITVILRMFIFAVIMIFTFYVGWVYISLGKIFNFIFLVIVVIVFWKGPRETLITLLYALVLRIIMGLILHI